MICRSKSTYEEEVMKKMTFAAVCIMLMCGCGTSGGETAGQTEKTTGEEIVNDALNISSKGVAPNTVNAGGMGEQVRSQLEEEQRVVKDSESYIFD